jgi:hypothetical protein
VEVPESEKESGEEFFFHLGYRYRFGIETPIDLFLVRTAGQFSHANQKEHQFVVVSEGHVVLFLAPNSVHSRLLAQDYTYTDHPPGSNRRGRGQRFGVIHQNEVLVSSLQADSPCRYLSGEHRSVTMASPDSWEIERACAKALNQVWRPQRDSNPRYRRERAMS